jgi:hypothetical protein
MMKRIKNTMRTGYLYFIALVGALIVNGAFQPISVITIYLVDSP